MIQEPNSQAGHPAATPVPSQANPPHRILVEEHDDDIRRLNTEVLIRVVHHLNAAEDGAVGRDSLPQGRHGVRIEHHPRTEGRVVEGLAGDYLSKVATASPKAQKRDNTFSKSRDTHEDRGTRQMKTTHNSQTLPH